MPALKILVLFVFIFSCYSQPLQQLYLGFDGNSNTTALLNLENFLRFIPFINISQVEMTEIQLNNAINNGMDILYLMPGSVAFDNAAGVIVNQFVSTGGVLLYTAGFSDTRAMQVAEWLGDAKMNVQTFPYGSGLNSYYNTPYRYQQYNSPFAPKYRGSATNQSLSTTFSRMLGNTNFWGAQAKSFANDLYYLGNTTYRMTMDEENQPFCLFATPYEYNIASSYSASNDCWVFSFPHVSGYAVALPFTFSDPDMYLYQDFVRRALSVVAAASSLKVEPSLFLPKPQNIVINSDKYQNNNNFENLVFDLALVSNVYLGNSLEQTSRLQNLTEPVAVVIIQADDSDLFLYKSNVVATGTAGNFVEFYFGYTNSYYSFNTQSNYNNLTSSFGTLTSLDAVEYQTALSVSYDVLCRFVDSMNFCHLYMAKPVVGGNYFSFLSWDFSEG